MVKKLSIILVLISFVFGCSTSQLKPSNNINEKPNFVIILADDLGYTDVVRFYSKLTGDSPAEHFYETPNIDKLGEEGLSFSQAYATQLCSPTRAALISGQHSASLGVVTATPGSTKSFYAKGENPPEGFHPLDATGHADKLKNQQALKNASTLLGLPAGTPLDNGEDVETIAESLTGYDSAFVGKWHLGGHGVKGYQPQDQGFDALAYYDAGGSKYFKWRDKWSNNKLAHKAMAQDQLYMGKVGANSDAEYLTDALTEEATTFIDSRAGKNKPFLLYLAHFAVHTPMQGKKQYVDYFENKKNLGYRLKGNATYAAMVKSLDDSVGEIRRSLEKNGLDKNTYILFLSDNGGVDFFIGKHQSKGGRPEKAQKKGDWPPTSNRPLKGGKATLFEGGIRMPMVVYGPGLEKGKWIDQTIDVTDVLPTLVELAGLELSENKKQKLFGQSFASMLNIPGSYSEYTKDTYYWHYPFNVVVHNPDNNIPASPQSAIRKGDWKLIVDWHGEQKLYNLRNDPYEKNNLAATEAKLVLELRSQLVSWIKKDVPERYRAYPDSNYNPDKDTRPEFQTIKPSYF